MESGESPSRVRSAFRPGSTDRSWTDGSLASWRYWCGIYECHVIAADEFCQVSAPLSVCEIWRVDEAVVVEAMAPVVPGMYKSCGFVRLVPAQFTAEELGVLILEGVEWGSSWKSDSSRRDNTQDTIESLLGEKLYRRLLSCGTGVGVDDFGSELRVTPHQRKNRQGGSVPLVQLSRRSRAVPSELGVAVLAAFDLAL